MYKIYKTEYGNTFVVRLSDNTCIPFDPANTDYQEYLKWVSEGNQPISADEPTDQGGV